MTNRQLDHFTPNTLAAMIGDMSQSLAYNFDDGDMSAQEWDIIHAEMKKLYNVLVTLVGEEVDDMLQAAGADPEMVYYTA